MKQKIGLALSGGGFRASAFHLGTLRKLKELGILDKVDVISTISGGSITGAHYALNKDNFDEFDNSFRTGLKRNMLITGYWYLGTIGLILLALPFILAYMGWYYLFFYLPVIVIFLRYQFNLLPFSRLIENRYGKVFYGKNNLNDLPKTPLLAINSTNVETGRPFTFSQKKMSDSLYEYPSPGKKSILFKNENFPIKRAVMASTCVPFAFTPVKIDKRFFKQPSDYKLIDPTLIDGGVYDNQGIHKLTHRGSTYECDVVIISDAGTVFKPITKMNNTLMLLMQTSELFMNRIKNVQFMNNVILNRYLGKKEIAYFSLGYEPEECISFFADYSKNGKILSDVLEAHELTPEILKNKQTIISHMKEKINYSSLASSFPTKEIRKIARTVGTNLTALSDEKIDALVSIAEALTEIQIRLYCPKLIEHKQPNYSLN